MSDKKLLIETVLFEPEFVVETAWSGHLPYAHFLMRSLKPKLFVELGTHRGASYFAFCQTVKGKGLKTKTYAVDTWQGEEHAGYYDESVYQGVVAEQQKYSDFSTLLRMTFDQALETFEDKSIDLLHIDGFHTYEAVKHDFESWFPKLAAGATVIFHDTNERRADFGVYQFWDEITKKYEGFEFKHSHGLGVLQLPGAKVKLIPGPKELPEHLRFFETLGFFSEGKVIEKLFGAMPSIEAQKKINRRISQFEASTSWKITAPLRAVARLIKRK